MSALDCQPGKTHRFDAESGWCEHGCGVRDDRRVVSRQGNPIRGGSGVPAADDIRHRIEPRGDD